MEEEAEGRKVPTKEVEEVETTFLGPVKEVKA